MKNFEQLAECVAGYFKSEMEKYGFDSFEEMKKLCSWNAYDIRVEIGMAVELCGGYCYHDVTIISTNCLDEMKYCQFKKFVMEYLK